MSKICRVISTVLIIAGLGFLYFYTFTQSAGHKNKIFDKPSYYSMQNYYYIFLAGIAVLFFSLIGSFCSWMRAMEEKEVILPNAGYVSKQNIAQWVEGSSLDTKYDPEDETEILAENETEILTESETEILEEDHAEIQEDES